MVKAVRTVLVDEDTWTKFKLYAVQHEISVSKLVESLIRRFLNEKQQS